jgi:hypothetical protein
MDTTAPPVKWLELPLDIVRHILFVYLDGPSACAFASTCRRVHRSLTSQQRMDLRLRPRDVRWYVERARANAYVCRHCFNVFTSKEASRGHPCPPCLKKRLKKREAPLCCKRCNFTGPGRALMPWLYVKVAHLNQHVMRACYFCKCSQCSARFNMTEPHIYEICRDISGCMRCGVRCPKCLGFVTVCKVCNAFEGDAPEMARHMTTAHMTWLTWLGKALMKSLN